MRHTELQYVWLRDYLHVYWHLQHILRRDCEIFWRKNIVLPGGFKIYLRVSYFYTCFYNHCPIILCLLILVPWLISSYFGACLSSALAFFDAIHFAMNSASCFTVLLHSSESWHTIDYPLVPKALGSSKRHSIYPFTCSLAETYSPFGSPDIMHLGGLVSSILAANPANSIHISYNVISILHLHDGVEVENRVVGAFMLSPSDSAANRSAP